MWSTVIYFAATVILVARAENNEECHVKPTKTPASCCPIILKYIYTKDVKSKCNITAPSPSEGVGGFGYRRAITCDAVHCILNHYKLATSDKKINIAAFTKFMENLHADWKTAIDTSVQKCSSILEKTKYTCPEKTFMFCFMNYMIKNCPDSAWSQDEECTDVKTYMEKCPRRHHKKRH